MSKSFKVPVAVASAGAAAAVRWVGGTASGAPSTGTWAVGDYSVAQNGVLWICTAAGTPGTWVNAGSGGAVSSVAGRTGAVTLTAADVGAGTFTGAFTFSTAPQLGPTSGLVNAATFGARGMLLSASGATYLTENSTISAGSFVSVVTGVGAQLFLSAGGVTVNTVPSVTAGSPQTPVAIFSVTSAGLLTVNAVSVSGSSGAPNASRWIGANLSGAPSSGTWAVGDLAVAQDGYIWICTVAGAPGTWRRLLSAAGFSAKGSLIASSAAGVASELIASTDGFVLIADSASTPGMRWGSAPSASPPVTTVTTTGTSTINTIELVSNTVTRTVPVTNNGQTTIKNAGTGTVTVAPASGTIDGAANFVLSSQYASITLVGDGTNLWVI